MRASERIFVALDLTDVEAARLLARKLSGALLPSAFLLSSSLFLPPPSLGSAWGRECGSVAVVRGSGRQAGGHINIYNFIKNQFKCISSFKNIF